MEVYWPSHVRSHDNELFISPFFGSILKPLYSLFSFAAHRIPRLNSTKVKLIISGLGEVNYGSEENNKDEL